MKAFTKIFTGKKEKDDKDDGAIDAEASTTSPRASVTTRKSLGRSATYRSPRDLDQNLPGEEELNLQFAIFLVRRNRPSSPVLSPLFCLFWFLLDHTRNTVVENSINLVVLVFQKYVAFFFHVDFYFTFGTQPGLKPPPRMISHTPTPKESRCWNCLERVSGC